MSAVLNVLKKILIPVAAVLVTVALGIGLLLSGILPFSIQLSTADGATAQTAGAQPTPLPYFQPPPELHELAGGIYYDTGQRIINLADAGGYRFLRINIVLEFLPDSPEYYQLTGEKLVAAEEKIKTDIGRQRPLIDDVITDVLSSKKFEDIFSLDGKQNLRTELQEELNRNLRNRYVHRVLITDFVIQ